MRAALEGARPGPTRLENGARSGRAILAEASGSHDAAAALYREAAARWRRFGDPFEAAHALAGLGRSLVLPERAREAEEALAEADGTFAALGVCHPVFPQRLDVDAAPPTLEGSV